jgi:TRAP-type C4-dicarboxylate transport system permease large subunit
MMVAAGSQAGACRPGLIASSGVIAPILPPSIGPGHLRRRRQRLDFQAVHGRHRAGLLIGLSLWITVGDRRPATRTSRRRRASSAGEIFATFRRCGWALMLPVIILVGLRFGVFTPTEAGVVAAVYALFVSSVIYRGLKLSQLYGIFVAAAKTTAVVMFLVAAAMVSAWLITVADLPGKVVGMLQPLLGSPILLMAAIMVLVMIVGTAMDMTPTILILTPVLMPVVKAAGIDPVYFGVMFIMNNAIGLITPPVGVVLNVVAGVGRMSMDASRRASCLHAGAVPHHVPDGVLPLARHGAGELVPRLTAVEGGPSGPPGNRAGPSVLRLLGVRSHRDSRRRGGDMDRRDMNVRRDQR